MSLSRSILIYGNSNNLDPRPAVDADERLQCITLERIQRVYQVRSDAIESTLLFNLQLCQINSYTSTALFSIQEFADWDIYQPIGMYSPMLL